MNTRTPTAMPRPMILTFLLSVKLHGVVQRDIPTTCLCLLLIHHRHYPFGLRPLELGHYKEDKPKLVGLETAYRAQAGLRILVSETSKGLE